MFYFTCNYGIRQSVISWSSWVRFPFLPFQLICLVQPTCSRLLRENSGHIRERDSMQLKHCRSACACNGNGTSAACETLAIIFWHFQVAVRSARQFCQYWWDYFRLWIGRKPNLIRSVFDEAGPSLSLVHACWFLGRNVAKTLRFDRTPWYAGHPHCALDITAHLAIQGDPRSVCFA